MVADGVYPNDAETQIVYRLEDMGFEVTVIGQDDVNDAMAEIHSLVLISAMVSSGTVAAARLPATVQYTQRTISRETTATTISIDDDDAGKVFIFEHTSGTMVVNLNLSTAGNNFSIVNLGSGDVQIQDASGTIIGPSSSGTSLSFTGKSPGSRRVEVMVTDSREYAISGDL